MTDDFPDLRAIRNQARRLAEEGKYPEALEKHLWYHENALKYEPSQSGVRLSFALSDWLELGEKYPPALQAMIAIRDEKTTRIRSGLGDSDLFDDVSAYNRTLEENDKTVELFKFLHEHDPDLAKSSFDCADDSLVTAREYQLCSHYIPNPLYELKRLKIHYLDMKIDAERSERILNMLKTHPDYTPEMYARYLSPGKQLFTESVVRLIKILVGSDRKPEAEAVHAQALSLLEDPEFHTPINQALNPEQ